MSGYNQITAEDVQWNLAFGYAYGRMDAEDNNPNTSTYASASDFADHWVELDNGGSRPTMFTAWDIFRKDLKTS